MPTDATLNKNVPIVRKAVQDKLRNKLNTLLDEVEKEVKAMPEAQAINFERRDLMTFLDDLIYDEIQKPS